MRVTYEAVYTLALTSHEAHVLLAVLHGGAVAESDRPLLEHLRQGLLQGIASSLQGERSRFFTPPSPPVRPPAPPVAAPPEPTPAPVTPVAVSEAPPETDTPSAGHVPDPPY